MEGDIGACGPVLGDDVLLRAAPWVGLVPNDRVGETHQRGVIGRAEDVVEVVPDLEIGTGELVKRGVEEDGLHCSDSSKRPWTAARKARCAPSLTPRSDPP